MDDDYVRDARKGKAKVEEVEEEESDPDFLLPKAIPKSYSNLGEDVIYLKIVGPPREPEEVETDSPEAVRKILFRFRNKELHRICGNEDARLLNIQTASRATIGILSDTASRLHRHLYLELLGTANEVKIADLLITDVITEGYERPYIPRAFMPMNICHHAITILITRVTPLLGINGDNLVKMESESGCWIEVDTYPPEGKILERVVNIYGQGLDVTNAIMMINDRLSEYDKSVKVKDDMDVEEIGSGEESEKMEDEKQKDDEEGDDDMEYGEFRD
ncbi:hypothetical protein L2E82_36888 [Cichorium intybus]|uniref:Uncharacterized protein n=1 Tax=Cichorium intybus TaxID=13427 RepID=A0ACB9AD47_CICIN|nr:hypothetical protein L2E82_36888 [Cichorium intybus]